MSMLLICLLSVSVTGIYIAPKLNWFTSTWLFLRCLVIPLGTLGCHWDIYSPLLIIGMFILTIQWFLLTYSLTSPATQYWISWWLQSSLLVALQEKQGIAVKHKEAIQTWKWHSYQSDDVVNFLTLQYFSLWDVYRYNHIFALLL